MLPRIATSAVDAAKARNLRGALIVVAIFALGFVGLRACTRSIFNEVSKPGGVALAAAIEAYQRAHGRCPEKLEQLVPEILPRLPEPAEHTIFAYRTLPDGSQCWLAFKVHRDFFQEYDSRTRAWTLQEYDDSQAIKPGRQIVAPPE